MRLGGDQVLQLGQPGGPVEIQIRPGRDLPLRCPGGEEEHLRRPAQPGGAAVGELPGEFLVLEPEQLLAEDRVPQPGQCDRVRGGVGQRAPGRLPCQHHVGVPVVPGRRQRRGGPLAERVVQHGDPVLLTRPEALLCLLGQRHRIGVRCVDDQLVVLLGEGE